MLPSESTANVNMLGSKTEYLPEMIRCGLPMSSIPIEFGGTLFQVLQETIANQAVAEGSRVKEKINKVSDAFS
jgi:hypothetical protein